MDIEPEITDSDRPPLCECSGPFDHFVDISWDTYEEVAHKFTDSYGIFNCIICRPDCHFDDDLKIIEQTDTYVVRQRKSYGI